jgi:hypothetical protein
MIYKYVSAVVFGALLVALGYFIIIGILAKRDLKETKAELDNCLNSPIHVDTIYDTLIIYNAGTFVPKPLPKPRPNDNSNKPPAQVPPAQVPGNQASICEERYSEVYNFKGGWFRWTAFIRNCKIQEMAFPEIAVPKETVLITKTVDTCFNKKPAYAPKTHLGGYIGLSANNFKTFPGLSAGIYVTFQDKIMIQPGVLFLDQTLYGSFTVGFKFYTFNKN